MGRGMQWQVMSLWMTLRNSPDMWFPSSYAYAARETVLLK